MIISVGRHIKRFFADLWGFPGGSAVKKPPANAGSILRSERSKSFCSKAKRLLPTQETGVQLLGWEDPLEKEMATDSSTLAWKIPWTEEPGRLQYMGSKGVGHD